MTSWICITCPVQCHLKVKGRVEEMPDACHFGSVRITGKKPEWLRKV